MTNEEKVQLASDLEVLAGQAKWLKEQRRATHARHSPRTPPTLWQKTKAVRWARLFKLLGGFALVYHGWTEFNFYPFLFGLWMLLEARLSK